jgi:hypothetical protein
MVTTPSWMTRDLRSPIFMKHEVQALMAIQEVRQEMDSIDEDLKGWHLHVEDGSGTTLMSIPLDALMQ